MVNFEAGQAVKLGIRGSFEIVKGSLEQIFSVVKGSSTKL